MKHTLIEFTVDDAIAYFEELKALGIADDDLDGKNALLVDFIKRGKAKRVWSTDRTKEQIVEDLKRNYGNVLDANNANKAENNHTNLPQKES